MVRMASDGMAKVAATPTYDGQRLVTSPTSVQACKLHGTFPESLLTSDARALLASNTMDDGDRTSVAPADPYGRCPCATAEDQAVKRDFVERKRKALVRTIAATREKLLCAKQNAAASLPRIGSGTSPRPPQSLGGAQTTSRQPPAADTDGNIATLGLLTSTTASGGDGGGAATNGSIFAPRHPSPRTTKVVLPDSAAEEVARYYLQLKREADGETRRAQKWEEKVRRMEEKVAAATARRVQHAAEASEATSARLQSTLQRSHDARAARETMLRARVEAQEHRLDDFTEQRAATLNARKHTDRGEKERAAAREHEAVRLESLRLKFEEATKAAERAQQRLARDKQRRALVAQLHAVAYAEQNERARRAKDYSAEAAAAKVADFDRRQEAATAVKDSTNFDKMLQREAVAMQRRQITAAFKTHRATSPVPTMPWLDPYLSTVEAKNAALAASTPRAPRPPAAPRHTGPQSARRGPNSTIGSNASVASLEVREPFTFRTADPPAKQTFASWMYQSY